MAIVTVLTIVTKTMSATTVSIVRVLPLTNLDANRVCEDATQRNAYVVAWSVTVGPTVLMLKMNSIVRGENVVLSVNFNARMVSASTPTTDVIMMMTVATAATSHTTVHSSNAIHKLNSNVIIYAVFHSHSSVINAMTASITGRFFFS